MKCVIQFVGSSLATKPPGPARWRTRECSSIWASLSRKQRHEHAFREGPDCRARLEPVGSCQNMVQNCTLVRLALKNLILRINVLAANSIGTWAARVVQHDKEVVRS